MTADPRRLTRAQSAALRKVVPDTEVRAYRRDRDEPNNYGVCAGVIDRAQREAFLAVLTDAEQITRAIDVQVTLRSTEWRMNDKVSAEMRERGLSGFRAEAEDAKARYRRETAAAAREQAEALRALADRLDTLAAIEDIRAEDHAADAATARFVDLMLGRS